MPSALLNTKFKKNTSFNILILFTVIINFVIQVKLLIFKHNRPKIKNEKGDKMESFRDRIEGNMVKLFRFVFVLSVNYL